MFCWVDTFYFLHGCNSTSLTVLTLPLFILAFILCSFHLSFNFFLPIFTEDLSQSKPEDRQADKSSAVTLKPLKSRVLDSSYVV
jgi:hypothetical protein